MGKVSISGFMALRNAGEIGFPFVESIVSALPVCDEFLIADGYSTDDTWACLNELKSRYPDQIKLYQDEWPAWRDYGRVMVTVSNVVRARCRGDYCLYVESNEIMHEASRDEIRQLPRLFPDVELFRIPYLNYLGPNDQIVFDFRRRLFANKPRIALVGDAYDSGYLRWRLLATPRRFLPYVLHRVGEKVCYLRDPYHRYWGVSPMSYVARLRRRCADYDDEILAPGWREELEIAERVIDDVAEGDEPFEPFWAPLAAVHRRLRYGGKSIDIQSLGDHPRLIQPSFGQWVYDPWASLQRIAEGIDA